MLYKTLCIIVHHKLSVVILPQAILAQAIWSEPEDFSRSNPVRLDVSAGAKGHVADS